MLRRRRPLPSQTSTSPVLVSVDVIAVNDPPVFAAGPYTFNNQDEDDVTNIGDDIDVSGDITDPDGPGTGIAVVGADNTNGDWQYSINNGTNWLSFGAVSPTSAVLLASDAANTRIRFIPDADWNGNASIQVRGWDRSSGSNGDTAVDTTAGTAFSSNTETATITIDPVNDAPTLTTVSTLLGGTEETTYPITFAALAAAANEADVDSATINFRVEVLSSGTLLIQPANVAVTPGVTIVTSADTLEWTPVLNANGAALNAFTIVAHDGTDVSTPAVQVTIEIANVNDAPTLTSVATISGATEDTPFNITFATLAAAADEADIDSATIDFRVESVVTGMLLIGVTPVAPGTVITSTDTLIWQGAQDANGVLGAFTITAWDGALASVTPITVNVDTAAANDAPTLINGPYAFNNQDEDDTAQQGDEIDVSGDIVDIDGPGMGVAVVAADNANGQWQYSINNGTNWFALSSLSDTNATLLASDPLQTRMRFVPNADWFGNASIQVRAWDRSSGANGDTGVNVSVNGGTSAFGSNVVTATITIDPVNDAPSFTDAGDPALVVENAGAQTVPAWASAISFGPANEAPQTLQFNVNVTGTTGTLAFSAGPAVDVGTGNLTYTATGNGTASVEITLQDNGGGTDTSAPANITITVLPTPTMVWVNAAWTGTPYGTDPDGAGPASYFGIDSFATAQAGVNAVATGGTVVISGAPLAGITTSRTMTVDLSSGVTLRGASPVITHNGPGTLTVTGGTLDQNTAFPTILVDGGIVQLDGVLVLESSVSNDFCVDAQLTGTIDASTFGGNTFRVRGAGGGLFDNQTATAINLVSGTANAFEEDATVFSVGTLADNFSIEDRVVHAIDSIARGLVTWNSGNVYVTQTSNSIQNGIDAATAGDNVNVAAGTYVENVSINKALVVLGPNAGLAGYDLSRGAEAILTADTNDPSTDNVEVLVRALADDITIDGMTIDGNNPALGVSAVVINGIHIHARRGITNINLSNTEVVIDNLVVRNNILQNFGQRGISQYNGPAAPTTSTLVERNILRGAGEQQVIGLFGAFIEVTDNHIEVPNVIGGAIGVHVQEMYNARPLNAVTDISDNLITVAEDGIGILINQVYSPASPFNIESNLVQADATSTAAWGIAVWGCYNTTVVTLVNNTIEGAGGTFERGMDFWADTTTNNVTVTGGTIRDATVGVQLDDSSLFFGPVAFPLPTTISLSGLTVEPSCGTGILVRAITVSGIPAAHAANVIVNGGSISGSVRAAQAETDSTFAATLTLNGCNLGGGDGVRVLGASASATLTGVAATVSGTAVIADAGAVSVNASSLNATTEGVLVTNTGTLAAFANNSLTGFTSNGIRIAASAGSISTISDNVITGTGTGINNQSLTAITATQNWWGSATGPTETTNLGGTGTSVTSLALVAYTPWYASGTDTLPGTPGFQGGSPVGSPSGETLHAIPTTLVWTVQPPNGSAAVALSPSPTLRAQDGFGVLGFNFDGLNGDSLVGFLNNPSGATFIGSPVVQAVGGVVVFSNLAISLGGVGYTVSVTGLYGATNLFSPVSNPFNINNPPPVITSLTPTFVHAGSGAMLLQVDGGSFSGTSTVRLNGANRPTFYYSSTTLLAALSASDVATATLHNVTVNNPAPGGGTTAPLTFTVNGIPSAVNSTSLAVDENLPAATTVGTLSTLDAGPIGDTHAFTLVFGAGSTDNGSFAIAGSALQTAVSFNYEVKSSYSIRVRCTDSFGAWVEQVLVISVNDVNESPTASNDGWGTNEDTALNVSAPGVLGNDTDPDVPTTLTASLVNISVTVPGPEVASFTLNADGSFNLVPALNYNGVVTFQYQAFDGVLSSAAATVTVTINSVNDVPLAGNDTHGTNEDTVLNVAAPGVLGNDSDAHGGAPSEGNTPLTAVLVADVANGSLTLNSDGSFTYTPDPDFNGPDGFTYRAIDSLGGQSAIASVTINVAAQNDPPTVSVNAGLTVAEGASGSVTQSLLEVVDIEDGAAALTYTLFTAPQFGQLLLGITPLVATSTFTQQDINLGVLSYQHNDSDTTADTFEFYVTDSGLALLPAVGNIMFSITITPVNDAPDLQTLGGFTGAIEDTAFVITLAQLQANATVVDPDGAANHFRLGAILSGTLTMNGNPVTPGVTILGTGDQFEWTPPLNENTTFQTVPGAFSVAAWDGFAASTAVLDVNIAIDFYVNDPGSITAVNVGVLEDELPPTHSFPTWATFVTGGGADEPLNETLVSYQLSNISNPGLFTSAGQPAVSATGELTFETAPNAFGVCSFDIQAVTNDGRDTPPVAYFSPAQQFTITVTNVNDAPTLTAVTPLFGGTEGTTIIITWAMLAASANEADIDSSPVNFRIEQVLLGTLTLNSVAVVPLTSIFASGDVLEWTPPADDYGTLNAFTVVAHDGALTSITPITVRVFVDAVNDQPSLTAGNHTSDEDQGQVTVPGWATLQPGPNESHQTALQYTVSNVSNPALFSAAPTVDTAGTLRYTAAANISGVSTFDVTVQDNGGTTSGGVDTSIAFNFTITVNPVNDAPTLTSVATISGAVEDTPFNITFATIESAADEADIDSGVIEFRVESVVSGTLLIGATSVTPGTVITSADTLIWQGTQDANGVLAAFTITAWDGALASVTPITVNVDTAALNDAPTFSVGPDASVSWAAGAQTVFPWATGISAGPADEASQVLTFNVTGNTNAVLFSVQPAIAADGTLTFTTATNANGTATITLTLSDDGGTGGGGIDTSAPGTFDITVTAAPEIDIFRQVGVPIPDGTGVDPIGTTLPVASAQYLVYTIANTGNAPLALTGSPDLVAVTGASNCVAWVTHLPASSVGAVGSTSFRLMVIPQAIGAFSVNLSIDSNDVDESPYSFQVSGTAVDAPDIELARGFNDPLLSNDTDFTFVHPLTQNLVLDYTVRNVGTSDLVFGAPPASVTLELNCTVSVTAAPTLIAAGTADTLTLTVTPGVTGAFEFVLRIDSNDPDEDPFFIHGKGSWSAAPVPELEVRRGRPLAPADTDVVGLLPSGSASALLWEIRNLGAAPLALTSPITISGAVNCAAVVTLAPAGVVAPGSATLFGIDVQPATPGPFAFTLVFTSSDSNVPMFPLTVLGTATAVPTPEIAVERAGVWLTSGGTDDAGDFASGQFTPLFYRVVNEGTSALNLVLSARVLSEANCEIRILSNPDAAIAPQDDSVLVIGVRPLATGALSAVIQVRSDDSDEGSFIINLIGTGPAPDVRVEYPRFVTLVAGGTLDTGSHSSLAVPVTFVIRNVGTDPLTLTANAFSNEVNCTVSVTTPATTPVSTGGETDLVLLVTVLAAGPFSFDLDIQSNDADTPSFVVLVSGVASSGSGGGSGNGDDSNCSTGSGHNGWPALLATLGILLLALRTRRSRNTA